jgi:hypothetical protein
MSTVQGHPLVDDYLRRLERAAAHLPRARRAELVAEIRRHVDEALLEASARDEVAVRNALERLGEPEEIAAAAGPPARDRGALELVAMILVAIPGIGWIAGAPLVAFSRSWAGREKALGIAICLLPVVLFAFGFVAADGGGSSTPLPVDASPTAPADDLELGSDDGGLGPIEVLAVLVTLSAGPLAALYLGTRLRRPPVPGMTSA